MKVGGSKIIVHTISSLCQKCSTLILDVLVIIPISYAQPCISLLFNVKMSLHVVVFALSAGIFMCE